MPSARNMISESGNAKLVTLLDHAASVELDDLQFMYDWYLSTGGLSENMFPSSIVLQSVHKTTFFLCQGALFAVKTGINSSYCHL